MAVIPAGTERSGLKCVLMAVAGSDGTLRKATDTIHGIGAELANTMPVDGRAVVLQVIVDCDLDSVTPVANDGRTWNLVVHGKAEALIAIKIAGRVCDVEVELANMSGIGPLVIGISINAEVITPLIAVARRVAIVVRNTGAWAGLACSLGSTGPN